MGEALVDAVRSAVIGDGPRARRAEAAAVAIRAATGARWVGVYTVADGIVRNETWTGPAAPAYPTFAAHQGLTGHAIAARALAVSNDVAHDPRYLTNQADSGSELIVPIVIGDEVVGTLDIEEGSPGSFDGAAISRYEAVARQLCALWNPACDQ